MRSPITVDSPTQAELACAQDRMRATSTVYAYLIDAAGLGIAESWIEALDINRGADVVALAIRSISSTHGWVLSSTAQSERIAKRKHRAPGADTLKFSRRALRDARNRDEQRRARNH